MEIIIMICQSGNYIDPKRKEYIREYINIKYV